jgi:LmbE family N-acetylglucosaminyl deacetylase
MAGGILAIVAHPDDETFGCGGTLALHAKDGREVGVLCLTCNPPERRQELESAAKALGVDDLVIFDDEHPRLDPCFIRRVSDAIVAVKPRVVITHISFDYHSEHRLVHEVVKEAVEWAAHTTTYPEPWTVERLLKMEVNSLIPQPHVIVDISDVIERKKEAVSCYPTQLAKFPWGYYQEYTLKKAELRGVQGNCAYAEAFLEEPIAQNSPFFTEKATRSLV